MNDQARDPLMRARSLARKYFEMALNGIDPENEREIDELVDSIVAAAAYSARGPSPSLIPPIIGPLPDRILGPSVVLSNIGPAPAVKTPGEKFSEWLLKKPGSHNEAEVIGRSYGITRPVREWTEEECMQVYTAFKRPRTEQEIDIEARRSSPPADPEAAPAGDCPIPDGSALFRFVKDMEQDHSVSLLKPLDSWAKSRGFGFMMKEWDQAQVAEAYREVLRMLAKVGASPDPKAEAGDPPPAAAGQRPPASMGDVGKVRGILLAAVRRIAAARHAGRVDGASIREVLDSLRDRHPQRKVIFSVTACTDFELLSSTLAIAEEDVRELEALGGVPMPGLSGDADEWPMLFDETEVPRS